jgi:diguanylate cyclase (GGDEF)-like protein
MPVPRGSKDPRDGQIRRLGEALVSRCEQVVETIAQRTEQAGVHTDDTTQKLFARIGTIATMALAEWLCGGTPEEGRETAEEAWELFGQLAAHRAEPLHEAVKRCLRWRDVTGETLDESATELGVDSATLRRAKAMTQITLDVTLVRMCEVYEMERSHTEEELANRQAELAFLATHDQLTGLPNRSLILDRAEQMLGRARRKQTPVAALFINVDGFTSINDTLGHGAGNQLLKAVAARLDGIVRDTDALGRLSGDEFVVLAEEASLDGGAELIAERLQQALGEPFKLEGEAAASGLKITASIGIAIGERALAEELLRDAEIAMHRAKWEGRNRYVVFESGMQDIVQRHMELEMDLRGAVDQGEFFLVYQPTFDLRGMVPTGVETLIRWRCPTRGIVQPNDFIPLLEETGLIVQVGRWVLEEACRQASLWRASGHPISVAVNVSARQLDTDEFIDDVKRALSTSGLDARALTLEITETALMRNADETAARLHEIKQLGVRIAIDDFGTGYSSLAHLQRFPVDSLKIDRSFISQLDDNPEGAALIRTLVQLGKALSIETLAEGIEGQRELSLLREEQCDSGQGYLFARPLEVADTEAFLQRWRREPSEAAAVLASDGI